MLARRLTKMYKHGKKKKKKKKHCQQCHRGELLMGRPGRRRRPR